MAPTEKPSDTPSPSSEEELGKITTAPEDDAPSFRIEGIDLPDRYRLRSRIGSGGFGEVWSASDRVTGRRVAVKIVRAGRSIAGAALRHFEIEVRAAARLQHPNIASIYDVATGEDYAYLVLELAPGRDLRKWVHAGPLPTPMVRDVSMGVLTGLAYAHARGVIHRDLKPDNVVVQGTIGCVPRLVDFGIACLLDDRAREIDVAERILGTPHYMAPEQIKGELHEIGPATDLYAFGVMLFEMMTGRPLFDDTDVARVLSKHLFHQPTPLPSGTRAIPGLNEVLERLLAKRPEERYELAADALLALSALDWGEPAEEQDEPCDGDMSPGFNSGMRRMVSGTVALESALPPPPAESRSGVGLFAFRAPPLVGRDTEQQQLWAQALQAIRSGTGRAVIVTGEPGIGKSRLVTWLKHELEEAGAMTSWCVVHQPDGGGGGLPHAIERALHLGGLNEDRIATRLRALLGNKSEDARHISTTVAALIRRGAAAADGPAVAHAAAMDLLTHVARARGLLLWIEDAQWAPAGEGLRLLDQLLESQAEAPCPLLVVVTLRTEQQRHLTRVRAELDLLSRREQVASCHLGEMPQESIERLLGTMVEVDVPVRRMIAERSGGNPLFAMQLLGHCLQSGAVTTRGGMAAIRDEELELPHNLQELCLLRMRGLEKRSAEHAEAVDVAELASLAGVRVPVSVLEAAAGDPDRVHRARRLLVAEGLWQEPSAEDIAFEHRLLRDCLAQRAAARDDHKAVHAAFATAWEAWGAEHDADVREQRARHFEAAGDLQRAAPLCVEVGRQRLDEGQFGRSATLYRRALAMLSKGDHDTGEAHLGLGRALEGVGALADAAQVLASACLELEGHSDEQGAALARAHLGWVEIWRANYDLARSHLERAEAALRREGDEQAVAYCLRGRCWVAFQTGDLAACEALDREALAIYERHSNAAGRGWCLKNLAAVRLMQAKSQDALALAHEALALFRTVHEHNGIASVLSDLGDEALARGEVFEALGHFDDMRREALLARNDNHRRAALARIATCELKRRRVTAANEVLDELALCLSGESSHWLMPTLQALRAWSHAQGGRMDAAREALELVGAPPADDPLRARAIAEARALIEEEW